MRKYNIDSNSFDKNFENKKMAYWLGFMAADGHVLKRESAASLFLQNRDLNHILKFKKYLNSSYPIIFVDATKSCGFVFRNKKVKEDLYYYNITNKKSLTLKPPKNLKEEHLNHFIRGYFDGDGCISCSSGNFIKINFNLLGTEEFLTWIAQILNQKVNLKFKMPKLKKKNGNIYSLTFSGRRNCEKIYNFLYQNSNEEILLDRKFEKFSSFLKDYKFLDVKKKIKKFDKNKNFLSEYSSIAEAERENNISVDHLRKSIKKNKFFVKNFYWELFS